LRFHERLPKRLVGGTIALALAASGAAVSAAHAAAAPVAVRSVAPTPMVRTDGTQEVRVTVDNPNGAFNAWARVSLDDGAPTISPIGQIASGNGVNVIAPVLDTHDLLEPGQTTALTLDVCSDAACADGVAGTYSTDAWARTRHWEFYLDQQMHTDLGYTNYQEDLRELFSGFLDQAKTLVANSNARDTDLEKYKYGTDSAWMMVEAYMAKRSADEVQEIVDLIAAGSMDIAGAPFQYTTENFATEEAARATYYTNRFLVDKLGIRTAVAANMFDNPAVSRGYVDQMAQAGIEYLMHSMNPDRSPYNQRKLNDLFYMEGMDGNHRLLIFNAESYGNNYGFGGTHGSGAGSRELATSNIMSIISRLEARTGRLVYPYDKFPLPLVPTGDNKAPLEGQILVANQVNEAWDDAGYAYPHIKTAFPRDFFEDVEAEYGDMIPVETGTEENWWNDGWATTAYESGTNKEAGALIPVAETTATLASLLDGAAYPYDNLDTAWKRNLTYDEHTWGAAGYDGSANYHNQFEWKRSNAFGAKSLGDKVLDESLATLSSQIPTAGQAVYVYNPLSWARSDVVEVDAAGLPPLFEVRDGVDSLPYTVADGVLKFIGEVPALGYKTFDILEVSEAPANSTPSDIASGDDFIENAFYRATFAADGTISSIIDKRHGDRELIDPDAAVGFNQYQYYDAQGSYTPEGAVLAIDVDAIGATATVDASAFRTEGITQTVRLYHDIPRIDIVNDVVKGAMPSLTQKEDVFYTFPFAAQDYEIRYDLPTGNVAEGEQVEGTSHDFYTASKWVNVQDTADGLNMTLAIPNSSLLQFGERRTGNWSFDYVSSDPYIYSYIMNNQWHTNFQGDQPGLASFRYALSTNDSAGVDETARFGYETSYPVRASLIGTAQTGTDSAVGTYMGIGKENVVLTTMKPAEDNSDGVIVRFHEVTGKDTTGVVVSFPQAFDSVTETDIIENDLSGAVFTSGNRFIFDIDGYGVKTFRLRLGSAPATVAGLAARTPGDPSSANLSVRATATAQSTYSSDYGPDNAKATSAPGEWASSGLKNAWYRLTWDNPMAIGSVVIADRPNSNENITSASLTFSNGTIVSGIAGIPGNGEPREVVLESPVTATWVQIDIVGASTATNIGLLGLETYPPGMGGVTLKGTNLTWDPTPGATHYEVFRSTEPSFEPGPGTYLASTAATAWQDPQVTDGMAQPYYYRVRAVAGAAKGAASAAVTPTVAILTDSVPPGAPILTAEPRLTTRIDLYWTPVTDNVGIDHYEIWRDSSKVAQTTDNYVTTYRDKDVAVGATHVYTVKAVDLGGNVSSSEPVTAAALDRAPALTGLSVDSGALAPAFDPATRQYALRLGANFGRLDDVVVTPAAAAGATVTVDGVPVAPGADGPAIPNLKKGQVIQVKVVEGGETGTYSITASDADPIIAPAAARAGSVYSDGQHGPENAINDSGMTNSAAGASLTGTHDNNANAVTMWHTAANPGADAWITIDAGQTLSLDELWVWNMNQSGTNYRRGLKNVKIQYSDNPDAWSDPAFDAWSDLAPRPGMVFADPVADDVRADYPFQLAVANGQAALAATNLNDGLKSPVAFDGVNARYVRVTAHPTADTGSWGDVYFGLSELRLTTLVKVKEIALATAVTVTAEGGATAIVQNAGTLQLSAEVAPSGASIKDCTWSVANPDGTTADVAAGISAGGLLKARKNGTVMATATATDGSGVSGRYEVTISGQARVVAAIGATAGSQYEAAQDPLYAVNGAGMSGMGSVSDLHGNLPGTGRTMWHTEATPGDDAWIVFDLGADKTVEELWVWNFNLRSPSQQSEADRGFRDVKIEYMADGGTWAPLRGSQGDLLKEYPYRLAKATGLPDLAATNLEGGAPIELGRTARYWRVTADPVIGQGNWGGQYYGLAEVRFVGVDADVTGLEALIAQAAGLVAGDYTTSSWAAASLVGVIEDARVALAEAVSQAAVDEAAGVVAQAVSDLDARGDASELAGLVGFVQSLASDLGGYTQDSADAVADALQVAETIDVADSTQADLNRVRDDLLDALAGLTAKPVDKTVLGGLLTVAGAKVESDYKSGWSAFLSARQAAQVVSGNSAATQTEVNAAAQELAAALDGLVLNDPPADKTGLVAMIGSAEARAEGDYKGPGWDRLLTVLDQAKSVVADSGASQGQVNAAVVALTGALGALEPADPVVVVDSAALDAVIAVANGRVESHYASGWPVFAAALADANAAKASATATQADIDLAVGRLVAAINALAIKSPGPSQEDPPEDVPDGPQSLVTAKVKVAQSYVALVKGKRFKVVASGYTQTGASVKVTFSTSNKKVATVSKAGVVRAKKAGKATITVKSGAQSAKVKVVVFAKAGPKVTSVKVKGLAKTLTAGNVYWVTGSYASARATGVKVAYKSDAKSILRIDNTGRVEALQPGAATITIQAGGKTKKVKVRVE
jgi:hypothetical protein